MVSLFEHPPRPLVRLADAVAVWIRTWREKWSIEGTVCYFPSFSSTADLTNHYHRAAWYAPRVEGQCERVFMFQTYTTGHVTPGERPPHMCDPTLNTSHIRIQAGRLANVRTLLRSKVILVWRGGWWTWILLVADRCGFAVANVDTSDARAVEYGAYCSLIWKQLLPGREKHAILQENQRRFKEVADRIAQRDVRRAYVFGTGPSLEDANNWSFSDGLTIVCNSIVQNDRLLGHIDPDFIAAADVVSHFGVSTYADQFRADLVRVLQERDAMFITTATFGYLFVVHHPEVADRVILVNQTCDGPNYNLLENFCAAKLDSIMNILMLPIAATFCKEIYLLGCDGKSTKRNNEDFWAHAKGAQYDDLVDSGHRCHPTFDIHRQKDMYSRYNQSIERTILTGEREHQIRYRSLRPSNIPVLTHRQVGADGG